jgi:hypothetical protein
MAPTEEGAAARSGAVRAIDSSARPRLLADLRPAPPTAASQPDLAATQGDARDKGFNSPDGRSGSLAMIQKARDRPATASPGGAGCEQDSEANR